MKALSLLQPWASLVAIGAKKWETRNWRTHHRGLIAVHASLNIRQTYDIAALEPFCTALRPLEEDLGFGPELALPKGAIIAVAEITDCITTKEWMRLHYSDRMKERFESEHAFGNYDPARFAWKLENVRALTAPIECKGAPSLWNVPTEITAKIEKELGIQTMLRRYRAEREYELFRDGSGPT